MNQFFEGRQPDNWKSISTNSRIENRLFVGERPDKNLSVKNVHISQSTFANMGFKESTFSDSNLSFNVFIDCYFKNSRFYNANFTGCKFINCTFEPKVLQNCIFDHAIFENTHVKFDVMKRNLPRAANLRWRLCINLGLQALHAGDSREYRYYFFEEKKASDEHFWDVVTQPTDYYKRKYGLYDQLRYLLKLISSKFNKFIWGYGERIFQLVITFVIILVFYALLYLTAGASFISPQGARVSLNLWESLYQSACNYFNASVVFEPTSMYLHVLSSTESFVGVIWTGFFIAALYKFINRR